MTRYIGVYRDSWTPGRGNYFIEKLRIEVVLVPSSQGRTCDLLILFCTDVVTPTHIQLSCSRPVWQILKDQTTLEDLRRSIQSAGPQLAVLQEARSALWKVTLIFNDLDFGKWPVKLKDSREAYDSLKEHYLKQLNYDDEADSGTDPLNDGDSVRLPGKYY